MPEPIPLKNAVQAASKHLESLIQLVSGTIAVEETEISPDRKYWLITLSYWPAPQFQSTAGGFAGFAKKEWRLFTVSTQSGEVLSMKIRLIP